MCRKDINAIKEIMCEKDINDIGEIVYEKDNVGIRNYDVRLYIGM
jgi:hypothetical protein